MIQFYFTMFLLFPSLYLYLNKDGYSYYLSLIMITVSLLYARITIELHIAICTSKKLNLVMIFILQILLFL